MRSFANYRWVLTVAVLTAVFTVYFYGPSAAFAANPSSSKNKKKPVKCSKGEAVSARPSGGVDCASCAPVSTPPDPVPQELTVSMIAVTHSAEEASGTNASLVALNLPGTGGMLDAEAGSISLGLPIGIHICGSGMGAFGLTPDGANVVAVDNGGSSHYVPTTVTTVTVNDPPT